MNSSHFSPESFKNHSSLILKAYTDMDTFVATPGTDE